MNDFTKSAELEEYPVVIRQPIQWGDQDAFGHVNNTVPIRWFESARIVYLEACGLAHMMTDRSVGPILAKISCNYRRQLTYPDHVQIGARATRIGRTSLTISHAIVSESQAAMAADGESVVVAFDFEAKRPLRVSDEIRAAIERLEGKGFQA